MPRHQLTPEQRERVSNANRAQDRKKHPWGHGRQKLIQKIEKEKPLD